MSETAPHENPLVPNAKLRQIYTAMVEARLLDEYVARLQRKAKARHRLYSTFGQEAARVTMAVGLKSGDLISDVQINATMDFLLGARLHLLLRHIAAVVSGTKDRTTMQAKEATAPRQLPWTDDADDPVDRLKIAIGAAVALKMAARTNVVVAYVEQTEISKKDWKQILALAAKLNLPIIFVVLPGTDGKNTGAANVCAKARSAGIPGIPVDANDAVALYRVTQESLGRSRGGDGPVLIECVPLEAAGQRTEETDDSILRMKEFLIGRKVCDEAWANHAGDAFRKNMPN